MELFFTLRGSISRREWWKAQGWIALFVTPLLVWAALSTPPGAGLAAIARSPAIQLAQFGALALTWAPTVKRYHDLGRSGWWFLLIFVPLANFWQLYECGFRPGRSEAQALA